LTAWGNTTDRILLLLQDHELTKAEICAKLELTHNQVASVLTRLKRSKRIYVCDWKRSSVGKRLYLRAVYTVGSSYNAYKPQPLSQKERSAKSHQKKMLIKNAAKLNAWTTI